MSIINNLLEIVANEFARLLLLYLLCLITMIARDAWWLNKLEALAPEHLQKSITDLKHEKELFELREEAYRDKIDTLLLSLRTCGTVINNLSQYESWKKR